MWQVSYVFKSCTFKEYVIGSKDRAITWHATATVLPRFLERAKERKYTNIRWRKV